MAKNIAWQLIGQLFWHSIYRYISAPAVDQSIDPLVSMAKTPQQFSPYQGCQVFSPLQCQIWLSIMPDLCQIMPDFFSYCQIFICVIEGIKQFNRRFQRRFHTYLEPFSLEFPKSDQIGKKIKKGPKIFLSLAEKDFADSSFSSPFQREGGGV